MTYYRCIRSFTSQHNRQLYYGGQLITTSQYLMLSKKDQANFIIFIEEKI